MRPYKNTNMILYIGVEMSDSS